MQITIAKTDAQVSACFSIMQTLRQTLTDDSFVRTVRKLEAGGYQLAYVQEDDRPIAVAGFRLGESLAWGRYLYVDDLVTDSSRRSRGVGKLLLRWLQDLAARAGCGQVHLDCGLQRHDAQRFYQREGMQLAGYHYVVPVTPG